MALGFDAFGRLTFGQISTGQDVAYTLVADSGSYVVTGQAAAFLGKEYATSGAYAIAWSAVASAMRAASQAGTYTLTGSPATLDINQPCGGGSYALTGYGATFDLGFQSGVGSYNVTGQPIDFIASLASETGKYVITGYEAGYTLIRDAWYPRPFDQDQWNASQVQAKPLSIWTDASQSLESWTPKGPSQ